MKSLIKISITDCARSLMPIIMWYIIGIVYGDTDYFNVFLLTYPFQFVWSLLYNIVIIGSIKYKSLCKEVENDYVYCAILITFIIFVLFSIIVFINIPKLSPDLKYNSFYVYSLACLSVDLVVCGLCKVEQYNGNNKKAFEISIESYITRILLVIIVKLLIQDKLIAVKVTILGLLLHTLILCIIKMRFNHIYFNIFKGVKYQISDSVSSIAMFIIYFFGIQKVVSSTELILVAYNTYAMCTDTQWDVMWSAIETNTSIEICNGNYDKRVRRIVRNSVLYTLLLILSSIIMFGLSYILKPYDIKAVTIIFTLECIAFPLYGIRYVFESYLMLVYHGPVLTLIPITVYILRIILTFILKSYYALSISVLVCAIYGGIAIIILYVYIRKSQCDIKHVDSF